MRTSNDLFLSEESKDTVTRRSVAAILAEDQADIAELEKLAQSGTSYKKISLLKASCAWGFLHKKFVAVAVGVVSFVAISAGITIPYWTQNVGVETVADNEPNRIVAPITKETAPVQSDSKRGEGTYENIRLLTEEEQKLLQAIGNQKKIDDVALSPITDVQIGENLEMKGEKQPVQQPKVVSSIAIPINTVTIHEGEAGMRSASEIIDSMGIGSEADGHQNMMEEEMPEALEQQAPNSPAEEAAEATSTSTIRYQIIDREGEKAGFQRMKNSDPKTTQWFLVIEAVNEAGVAQEMPVMDMDDGEIRVVRKWAIQVEEEDFMKFSAEKKKSGKIAEPTIGSAPSDETQPKWTVGVTGDMLTKWD